MPTPAKDDDAAREADLDALRRFYNSPDFPAGPAECDRALEEVVTRFGDERTPRMRSLAAATLLALASREARPPKQLDICRRIIRDYTADAEKHTREIVLHAASRMLGWLDEYGTKEEALRLCEQMLTRYGRDATATENSLFLNRIRARRLEIINDKPAMLALFDSLLAEAVESPEAFSKYRVREILQNKARIAERSPADVVAEWCDAVLAVPRPEGFTAVVLALKAEMSDGASSRETRLEAVRRFAGSADTTAATTAALLLASPALENDWSALGEQFDSILKQRDRLPPSVVGLLLLRKATTTAQKDERIRLYDEALALKDRRVENTAAYASDLPGLLAIQRLAFGEKAALTGDADAALARLRELATAGKPAREIAVEALYLGRWEREPARRGPLYDAALVVCRAAADAGDDDVCHAHIELLCRRAEGMRSAAAAMALYREAVDVFKRTARRRYPFPPVDAVMGMIRLTPDRAGKAALYDDLIAMFKSSEGGSRRVDELIMEKTGLLEEDAATRETVFAEILNRYNRPPDAALLTSLAAALRAWRADCAAANRDPWNVDVAAPTREGETYAEARYAAMTAQSPPPHPDIPDYPDPHFQQERRASFLVAQAFFAAIMESADADARRRRLRVLLDVFGGQFDPNTVHVTLQAREQVLDHPQ